MNQATINNLRLGRIRLDRGGLTLQDSDRFNLMWNQAREDLVARHTSSFVDGLLQIEENKTTVRASMPGTGVAYELQVNENFGLSEVQRYCDVHMVVSQNGTHHPQNGTYAWYGPSGLVLQLGTCRISTSEERQRYEPLRVVAKDLATLAMEVTMTIKTFRRMLNGVAKLNNRVFSMASHEGRWNVFSETPTTVGTRWRVTPTIYSSAIGGVKYKKLYDFFFRKKQAVRGVFTDLDEDTEITLCLRDNGEIAVKLQLNSFTEELFVFEPDASTMGLLDLLDNPDFELPFMGRTATATEEPEQVTAVITEEPTEEVEEPAQEPVSFTQEETERMSEWSQASVRHQQAVGAPASTSPQIWFSHYMMERLRQGEAIDDLDNQILAKL